MRGFLTVKCNIKFYEYGQVRVQSFAVDHEAGDDAMHRLAYTSSDTS